MTQNRLPEIQPKEHHNYVAFFLTLACNLKCHYCINLQMADSSRALQAKRTGFGVEGWIEAANRLVLRDDLPLTLQGGEPTLFPGFYRFVNEVKEEIRMDLMTNLMFDPVEFVKNVPVWRFTREAPYASIRASYHPGQNRIEDLVRKVEILQDGGFRVGLYGIEHPDEKIRAEILEVQQSCLKRGIDFRLKEFLGEHEGSLYGTFKFDGCVNSREKRSCECRTTEILVDPQGQVYSCHADLYDGRRPIAHILDPDFSQDTIDIFRDCDNFGGCNPCDVKVKTNRFQVFGHTSVEIRNLR